MHIDLPLPYFFYKIKFEGVESITLDDYAQWQPETAKSLQYILDYDPAKNHDCPLEDIVMRDFTVDVTYSGVTIQVDLIENGSQIEVNMTNRHQYVREFIKFDVQRQAQERMDSFWKGLSLFVHPSLLKDLFLTDEMPVLISGQQKLNFDELKKSVLYLDGYKEDHPMIRWFWEIVIEEWDDEQRRKLLMFSTGTDRAPVSGLKSL